MAKGFIETKDVNGNIINEGAPIKSGDIVKLMSGYHGKVYYRNSYNDALITIEAEQGEFPELSRLQVHSAKNLLFKGLTISPSFTNGSGGKIVDFCSNKTYGLCKNISLMNSYIYTVEDSSNWSQSDWDNKAADGVVIAAKAGDNFRIINNMILNVNFGLIISTGNSFVSGNVVSNYSADGIRLAANDSTVQLNIIKNAYDVNDNHDDAIQGYRGAGGVQRDLILNNIILLSDDPFKKYNGWLQGIGFFDGPLEELSIFGNVVDVSHYHGISLYDTYSSLISDNVVANFHNTNKTWIKIGSKTGGQGNKDNQVEFNKALSFQVSESTSTFIENTVIKSGDYKFKFYSVLNEISDHYGDYITPYMFPRVSDYYKNSIE